MKKYIFFIVIMTLLIGACEDSIEEFDPGYEGEIYFPLAIGHTWTYSIDSVIYDNNGLRVDSVSSLIKEYISEAFMDAEGKENFRIERSRYNNSSGAWQVIDIWSTSKDNKAAYKTEENLRFSKLNFPVVEGKVWDGNAFIDEEIIVRIAGEPIRVYQNWGSYQYSSVGVTENIEGLTYDSVCIVDQVDIEDKISKRYSQEKYAKGIGLIYKKMIILNTQKFESNDSWEEKAEEGFISEQRLISFEAGS